VDVPEALVALCGPAVQQLADAARTGDAGAACTHVASVIAAFGPVVRVP
jgi:hypothetical protein